MQQLMGSVRRAREGRGIVPEREERETKRSRMGGGNQTGRTVLVYMDKERDGVTKNGISIYGYTRE